MMQQIDRTILVSEVSDRPLPGQKGGKSRHVFDKPSLYRDVSSRGNAER